MASTIDDSLFQSARWNRRANSDLEYRFTVPKGDYASNLYFAETIESFGAGKRVFDVLIEDRLMLDDLDVAGSLGSLTASVKRFTAHRRRRDQHPLYQ